MALVTMPATGLATTEYAIDTPAQKTRSDWTGVTKILLTSNPRWYASATVVPGNDAQLLPWRAFMSSARGIVNTFALVAVEAAQRSATSGVVVDGAGQTGMALAIRGLPVSITVLPAGSKIHVATTAADWQLFELTAALVSNGTGRATVALGSPLRNIYADGVGVEVVFPAGMMRLSNTRNGWMVEPGKKTPGAFDCEESF